MYIFYTFFFNLFFSHPTTRIIFTRIKYTKEGYWINMLVKRLWIAYRGKLFQVCMKNVLDGGLKLEKDEKLQEENVRKTVLIIDSHSEGNLKPIYVDFSCYRPLSFYSEMHIRGSWKCKTTTVVELFSLRSINIHEMRKEIWWKWRWQNSEFSGAFNNDFYLQNFEVK